MAKQTKTVTASAVKNQKASKADKAKGPKPDYTPKGGKVVKSSIDPLAVIKAQPIMYYGENRPLGQVVYNARFQAYSDGLSRNIAWTAAKEVAIHFEAAGREQLFKLAARVVAPIGSGGPEASYQLNAMEMSTMGFFVTAGVFTKRIRFWAFVNDLAHGRVPEGLEEKFQLPFTLPVIMDFVQKAAKVIKDQADAEPKDADRDALYVLHIPADSDTETYSPQFLEQLKLSKRGAVPMSIGDKATVRLKDLVR